MNINKDAFSSGQIGSKIWLCEELEKTGWEANHVYLYGGWHGLTAFLLLSRNKFKLSKIRSIDIDPECEVIADMINENWVWEDWKFKAITGDCNTFQTEFRGLIINTSTEHFESMDWFNNLGKGTKVVLQGNNMNHGDHTSDVTTLSEFKSKYPLSEYLYCGEKEFVYPDWKFTRFMIIGSV
jgi:hypothetical protein